MAKRRTRKRGGKVEKTKSKFPSNKEEFLLILQNDKHLEKEFNVSSTVFSVTSFTEVRRNALDIQRWNMLNPDKTEKKSTLDEIIVDLESPIITATDYMKSFAEQIATFLPNKFISLGTDGFGRSDSREALRDFFEIDRNHIVVAALKALTEKQEIEKSVLLSAIKKYKIMNDKPNPVSL